MTASILRPNFPATSLGDECDLTSEPPPGGLVVVAGFVFGALGGLLWLVKRRARRTWR